MAGVATLFALAVPALLGPQERPGPEDVRAVLTADRDAVEVGEPFTLTLQLEHPEDALPELPGETVEAPLALGEHWLALDSEPSLRRLAPGSRRMLTRKSWTVIGLAPTEELPALSVRFRPRFKPHASDLPEGEEDADGSFVVATEPVPLAVATVLGDTVFHRPSKGFRDELPASAEERLPWWVFAAGATVALGLAALVVRALRRRGPARPAPEASALERLSSLAESKSEDLPSLQALHYSLTALLREEADARLARDRSAATDEEWLEDVRAEERVPAEVRAGLELVLARSSEVKYARHKPTPWAVEETLGAAREALAGLEALPRAGSNGAGAEGGRP